MWERLRARGASRREGAPAPAGACSRAGPGRGGARSPARCLRRRLRLRVRVWWLGREETNNHVVRRQERRQAHASRPQDKTPRAFESLRGRDTTQSACAALRCAAATRRLAPMTLLLKTIGSSSSESLPESWASDGAFCRRIDRFATGGGGLERPRAREANSLTETLQRASASISRTPRSSANIASFSFLRSLSSTWKHRGGQEEPNCQCRKGGSFHSAQAPPHRELPRRRHPRGSARLLRSGGPARGSRSRRR